MRGSPRPTGCCPSQSLMISWKPKCLYSICAVERDFIGHRGDRNAQLVLPDTTCRGSTPVTTMGRWHRNINKWALVIGWCTMESAAAVLVQQYGFKTGKQLNGKVSHWTLSRNVPWRPQSYFLKSNQPSTQESQTQRSMTYILISIMYAM